MNQDDDVIAIGKLRRVGKPGAAVSFDPGYGIRIAGEPCPPDSDQAARWVKAAGGWLRLRKGIPKGHPELEHFLKAVRHRGPL